MVHTAVKKDAVPPVPECLKTRRRIGLYAVFLYNRSDFEHTFSSFFDIIALEFKKTKEKRRKKLHRKAILGLKKVSYLYLTFFLFYGILSARVASYVMVVK